MTSTKSWLPRITPDQTTTALAISQRHGLDDIVARIIASRGVDLDDVEDFLQPSLKKLLPNPDTLTEMQPAAQRFVEAILNKQSITIFGDYDVDGACSSALIAKFCAHYNLKPRIYIPDRITEGYGPNIPAIEEIAASGCQLLITVDCGATSFEPLARAAELKLDTLVLDHHQMNVDCPPAIAVVNPNRQDDISGLGHLCAAGVVFIFLIAASKILRTHNLTPPDLLQMLDIVALATVADVVPLTRLNRAYVTQGLKVLAQRQNIGLTSLIDSARVTEKPAPYHLGYILGPRINAGGRIGDAALGARLLTTQNESEAAEIAEILERLNKERQAIEMHHVDEAINQILALPHELPYTLSKGEGWHVGVVGLVAARLKERFARPAFAFAIDGEKATCSVRSVTGVDIGAIVRGAVELGLLIKGGGHAMAAGLTITTDRLPAFEAYLLEKLSGNFAEISTQNAQLPIDAYISAKTASVEFIKTIEALGPYGSGMPEPMFAFLDHTLAYVEELKNDHMRLTLKSKDGAQLKAMAWRAANSPLGSFLNERRGKTVNIAGTLSIDRWQGNEKPVLRVVDGQI